MSIASSPSPQRAASRSLIRRFAALAVLASAPGLAIADDPIGPGPEVDRAPDAGGVRRPLWELGVGVAGLRLPDYRGADQSRNYLLPLPYIVYRGKWLKADREGARAVLLDTARAELNLSVAASTPTRSKDNTARTGMHDLAGTFEIGPNLDLTLLRSEVGAWKLDLRLPLRAAVTLERSPRYIGATLSPNLNLDIPGVGGGSDVGLLAGPLFADRRYHGYFYDVAPGEATADRPVFRARGGYAGWRALAATSRRIGNAWIGTFLRYDSVAGAAFDDSPLVRRRGTLTAGFGVSWVFATSSESVSSSD